MRSRHSRNAAGPLAGASSKAFVGQRVALASEQQAGRRSRRGRGSRAAGRRDCPPALGNRPRRSRATWSPCFIWSRSGIGNSVNRNLAPAHRCQCLESTMRIWQLHDFLRRTYSSARVNQNWIGLASFRLRRFRGTLPPASLYERVDRSTSRWRHRRRNGSEALDHPRRGNCDPRLHNYL